MSSGYFTNGQKEPCLSDEMKASVCGSRGVDTSNAMRLATRRRALSQRLAPQGMVATPVNTMAPGLDLDHFPTHI